MRHGGAGADIWGRLTCNVCLFALGQRGPTLTACISRVPAPGMYDLRMYGQMDFLVYVTTQEGAANDHLARHPEQAMRGFCGNQALSRPRHVPHVF